MGKRLVSIESWKFKTLKKMRYNDPGDWTGRDICVYFYYPKKYRSLILYHEFIERALCEAQGITPRNVDRFDSKKYQQERETGDGSMEPLYRKYREAHHEATRCEMKLAALMGVDWVKYDNYINTKVIKHKDLF